MRSKKIVITPKLYNGTGSVESDWFVYYSILNPFTNKLERFRVRKGFAKCLSVEEKQAHAKSLIQDLDHKLRSGWTPFLSDENVIYEDDLQYKRLTTRIRKVRGSVTTFNLLASKFLKEIVVTDVAHETMNTYRSKLRIFERWLIEKGYDSYDISGLTLKESNEFYCELIGYRKVSAGTRGNYIMLLKQVWDFAIAKKFCKSNIWSCFKIEKNRHVTPSSTYSDAQMRALSAIIIAKDPQLWIAVKFIFHCFTRPKELRFLQIKHIDFESGRLTIPALISKNNRTRVVDIPDYFLEELIELGWSNCYGEYYLISTLQHPGPRHVSKNYLYRHFDVYRKELKIPADVKFYGIKHTGVKKLALAGIDYIQLKNQLGHASLDQVISYAKELLGTSSELIKKRSPRI